MADGSLEERLRALGEALEFPREDTLVDDVLAGTRRTTGRGPMAPAAARRRGACCSWWSPSRSPCPSSRHTIARWLGFDDCRIERVDVIPPTVTVPPEPAADRSRRRRTAPASRPLVVAGARPDRVEVQAPLGRYVVVRYDEALVATLPGTLDEGLVRQARHHRHATCGRRRRGAPGYWISGGPHVFLYTDADGEVREVRPAADTLVWQHGDIIVRIEGDITLERAQEIAATLREP